MVRTDAYRPPAGARVVYLTGAGLSARAGLPTFRGEDGLWALHPDLEQAMHGESLPESLPDLWRTWPPLFSLAQRHGPTPGHRAIARMGGEVITQNIDGLHQAAGSEAVAELHGSAGRAVCLGEDCAWSAPLSPGEGERPQDHGAPEACPLCGSPTRPDVVLFDEVLPMQAVERAECLAKEADVFTVVGTSGVVFPAASLAPLARRHGAITVLIDINPDDPLTLRSIFDHVIIADAHEVLPSWEAACRGAAGGNPFLHPF